MLPQDIRNLILDFYYSHKMFKLKKRLHSDLISDHFTRFLTHFFRYHVRVLH